MNFYTLLCIIIHNGGESKLSIDLKGRDYLTLKDFSTEEIIYLVKLSLEIKEKEKQGIRENILGGKTLAMIFQKPSTRTRVSFEIGMYQLGGQALFLNTQDLQMGRGETIADTARVLSRFADGIMIRTYDHVDVEQLAEYASIPVINGLTDLYHPTQALADLLTIYEHKGYLKGIKLSYVGDGNNMIHSLMLAGAKLGMEVNIATPKGYEPLAEVVQLSQRIAKENQGKIILSNNPQEAVENTDVIYTDTWISMGQEKEREEKINHFQGFQVNNQLVSLAKKDVIIMHCLPAHRGEEITDEVMDGPQSVVFDEAENRLHAHKGIMAAIL